jgi:hypothetical protein
VASQAVSVHLPTLPASPLHQSLLPPILPWLRSLFFHSCWLSQTSATLFPFYSGHNWPWAIGSSGINTASLALSPCYNLTLLLPTCIPYLLPYLLPSTPSPSICSPASLRGYRLLPIRQSILTNLGKLSSIQLKTPLTFWDAWQKP